MEWKEIAIGCAGDELDYVKKKNIKIVYQHYLSSLPLFFEILLLYLAKCFDLDALETKGTLVSLGTLFAISRRHAEEWGSHLSYKPSSLQPWPRAVLNVRPSEPTH